MTKKNVWRINITLLAIAAAFVFVASKIDHDERPDYNWSPTENIPQIVKAVNLDQPFTFCGETLPMNNFDVRERLDRELTVNTYWHSSTLLSIKTSLRYFPMMDKMLNDAGLPTDLKYIAVAESALRNVTSPAGAKGFWQFMKGTGKEYGLEINSEIDERYHFEKSTKAAIQYLKRLKKRFGTWANVAGAYNMGGGNMNKRLETQRVDNYFDLNLNEETGRYYFRLVALKHIIENPRAFGFYLEKDDFYSPLNDYKVIEVNGSVNNWGDFAKEHHTTYRMLKIYNPWLIDVKLTNKSKKTYEVRVPNAY